MRKIFTCLSLLALFALSVAAQGQTSIDYIDENGETQSTSTYTTVTANDTEWTTGTYVATGDISLSSRVTVTGSVTLILADGCNLDATQGINVGEGQSLTVYAQSTEGSMGTLTATSTTACNAGIGGNDNQSCGTININGGNVTATGLGYFSGNGGAGIGGGNHGTGGTIKITKGTVTATGGYQGAGIGGGHFGGGGSITITGGTVKAEAKNSSNGGNTAAAGIGGGASGSGGTIIISGGMVTATANWGSAIGDGQVGSGGTFSTGENGNAVIVAQSQNGAAISDKSYESRWQCLLLSDKDSKEYKVYGAPTIEDFTIDSDYTLNIPEGTNLTILEGVTLTNNGSITNNGTISNNGTINGSGKIVGNKPTGEGTNSVAQYYYVTRHLNYEGATDPETPIEVQEGGAIPSDDVTRPYYTFEGWYDAATEGNKVESATTNNLEVYAHWMPKPFNTTEDGITFNNLVYGTAFEHTFTAEELSDNITANSNGLKSIAIKEPEGEEGTTNALPTGLTLEGLTLSGTPKAATPSPVTTILTLTANNGATADITLTFTIAKAKATVADWTTESPYIYTGKAITITAPKVTGINDEDVTYTDVTVAYKQGETDVEAAIEPGEYTATATYTGNSNYADTSKEVTFVIQSPDDITASASEGVLQAGDNGWTRLANGHSYPVTLTAPINYTFTEEAMATISGDGAHTYTLKRSESSQTATVSHTLYLDATAPTATLGTPSSTTVVLTLADATSGIAFCTVKEGETVLYSYPESTAETRNGKTEAGATTGKHSLSYTYTGEAGTSHTLTVSLTDMAGNTAEQTLTVTFTKYTITLQQPENGSISADKTEAAEGETVTLSYREDSNYDFAGWSVTTDDGTAVSVSGNTFTMPAANVTVTASFRYDPPYIPSYYDIYFDGGENDSVRYDCSNTTVRGGGTFAFYAEPTTGYDPETLIVEYKRGRAGSWKTVEPNSHGQYRITNVHADIYVRSRVEPVSDPTALDKVGDGKSSIRCDGRRIRISTTEPQTMHIINVGGRLIRTAQLPAGDTEVNDLPQGFYIVLLSDGTRAKTLIN